MDRYYSYQSLNVFTLERSEWEFPQHSHNHYELIFIEKGEGEHVLNSVTIPYKQGDVFLLTPQDHHYFIINSKTVFVFVKFTEQIFTEKVGDCKSHKWADAIKYIASIDNSVPASITMGQEEGEHIGALLKILKTEIVKTCLFSRVITLEIFGALMGFVSRNLNKNDLHLDCAKKETEKVYEILCYIRSNVFNSNLISIKSIATFFSMSPNYVSLYVKKHAGVSIQKYIMQTKMKAAEQLLKQSDLNINEIAERLGFNDASHFNKFFKKYKKVNPSKFGNDD